MTVRLLLATAAAVLLPASVAAAQAPGLNVTLTPNTPKSGTKLALDLDGSQLGDVSGQAPRSVRLIVQEGFRFDADAVSARCAAGAATCPDAAKIATGTAQAGFSYLLFSGEATATITAYLAAPARAGDLAGIVVKAAVPSLGRTLTSTGRVLRAAAPDGLELRFDDLLSGQGIPAGAQVTLRRLQLTAGASRTLTRTKRVNRKRKVRVRRNGRLRTVTRTRKVTIKVRERHHLLTTPRTCPGTWNGRGVVTLANGSERTLPVQAPCVAR